MHDLHVLDVSATLVIPLYLCCARWPLHAFSSDPAICIANVSHDLSDCIPLYQSKTRVCTCIDSSRDIIRITFDFLVPVRPWYYIFCTDSSFSIQQTQLTHIILVVVRGMHIIVTYIPGAGKPGEGVVGSAPSSVLVTRRSETCLCRRTTKSAYIP